MVNGLQKGGEHLMPILWADKAQVVSYIPRTLKERAMKLRRFDHRLTMSRIIEEGLREKVTNLEKHLKPQSR